MQHKNREDINTVNTKRLQNNKMFNFNGHNTSATNAKIYVPFSTYFFQHNHIRGPTEPRANSSTSTDS